MKDIRNKDQNNQQHREGWRKYTKSEKGRLDMESEVTKPKERQNLDTEGEQHRITDEGEIAEIFNDFFIKKIEDLKKTLTKHKSRTP